MIAVILNSGIGSRLGEYTEDKPKCLVPLSESETILSHQIRCLKHYGITDILMTTGYMENHIKEYMERFSGLSVRYVCNPDYRTTNYIYSLHLAREFLGKDDAVMLHGDMVCRRDVYGKILEKASGSSVILNKSIPVPEKDFKGRLIDERITQISVKIFGPDCFALFPVYRLCKEDISVWMEEIARFVQRGETSVYAEEALNNLTGPKGEINLEPCYVTDELCMEVDTPQDLETARTRLAAAE